MQIYHTFRATLLALALLACLPTFAPQPALAQQVVPPDTGQTKTDPNQPPPTAAATESPAPALTPIRDDSGSLAATVPPAWNDLAQGEWLLMGAPAGRKLSAAPNQAEFAANWGTPGVTIYHSTSLPAAMEPEDLLAVFDFSNACQDGGRGSLPPGERSVIYHIWQNCAEGGTAAAVLVVYPTTNRDFYGVIEIYLAGVDDLRALATILASVQFGAPDAAAVAAGTTPDAATTPAPEAAASPTLPPPTPTPQPTPTPMFATVIIDRLNLRSGPSTEVERLTVVTRGMQLTVVGQIDNCAWLRVTAPDGAQGWVSGDPQFTSRDAPCETIPVVENP
jgi:hypothetical protein